MITARLLARLLHDAFDCDEWGDIDPDLFRAVAEQDFDKEYTEEMQEALARAAANLNRLLNGEAP